ncbi:hypothetical protein CH63R_08239 [Colletotrichum higginsianum IMI 349063]|uniref:Uncharacterized protein n=2 Tax=Colletotrichum higginsianum TaxID=80884 RepID=A0A1B7YBZ3_COLHI|nr:hypothetical protein CH63R_08239 [Colletotrichum higginsianum IMI 349063]OBR09474.1 hypothetical protein CH63R_08239 [Colletotrichum higginsianum IMI 349063]TIC95179.1 hypothetical protein CH35J_007933 [Colletotrichum higginsianum]
MKLVQALLNSRPRLRFRFLSFALFSFLFLVCSPATSHAAPSVRETRNSNHNNNPLNIDWDPAPSPEDGPPASAGALRDPAYIPYQVGAIVGSYGVSLVLVAVFLLILSKRRREALSAANQEIEVDFDELEPKSPPPKLTLQVPSSLRSIPRSPVRNFSYPSADEYYTPEYPTPQTPYVAPTPTSTLHAPGVDFTVDQRVVAQDKKMAQSQLEEMYKYVMEQEEAKAQGIKLDEPPRALSSHPPQLQTPSHASFSRSSVRKEKHKPGNLNLVEGKPEGKPGGKLEGNSEAVPGEKPEKKQSRASSIFAALRSPKKTKEVRAVNISSPIMTPMTGTFPRHESQELSAIQPRQYAPPPPPSLPSHHHMSYGGVHHNNGQMSPVSPEHSPESTQSIDERIGGHIPIGIDHVRHPSAALSERDPNSAVSDRSTAPLIGLPSTPKPGARFSTSTLPASPRPGASFQIPPPPGAGGGGGYRSKAPSAVRTGGALPLRAYEPALNSPSQSSQTTKQTVFTRTGPLSPSGARTPATGMAVPYSPYQPFTPCVPMTPSLVTKADRKRMKKLEPKTPTREMVRSEEDIW